MTYSLIICGYNEERNVDMIVKSCLEQNYSKDNYEIIFVDNNSKDKTYELALKYPIKVYKEMKQGLSEARNCGIKNATGEILVFLDADMKLDNNYLTYHERTFDDNSVGAGGGKVLPLFSTIISNYLGVSLFDSYPRYKREQFVRTYPGCNLTIKRSVIEEVGTFQEKMISAEGVTRFAEDKEICERIRKAGYKIKYNSDAIVYHENVYTLKKLFELWKKGSLSRVSFIKLGKKDPFTILFRYNLPLLAMGIFALSLLNLYSTFSIFILYILILVVNSLFSYIKNGMFFLSFFVKPFLDVFSLLVVNIECIKLRYMK